MDLRGKGARTGSPRSGDWSEAICFLMAVLGTGGEKEFLAGIRQVEPTWMSGLRAVRISGPSTLMNASSNAALGATRLNDEQLPSGYANATVALARILT